MTPKPEVLTPAQLRTGLADRPDWRTRLGSIFTVYRAGSPTAAIDLVHAIGVAANELDHHPDVDWRYDHVFVSCTTHVSGHRVTALDLELAGRISALATGAGAEARPELFATVEIAVDTDDVDAARDTWAALLKYKPVAEMDLVDPWGRGPSIWFQKTPTPNANRIHLDVWADDEKADELLAETERAGAQRLDDAGRPSFTVIGDQQGNRFCICTNLGRD